MTRRLVVLGDALLDVDVAGSVSRVCPDSPAVVFEEGDSRARPGGAALAAALLAAAGRSVTLVTAIGADEAGHELRRLLAGAGVRVLELPYTGGTVEKVRLQADRQVVLRLDRSTQPGTIGPPGDDVACALEEAGAVLVSDYGRGAAEGNQIRRMLAALTSYRTVVWDPHPRGSGPVPGVQLVTPNESELMGDAKAVGPQRFHDLAGAASQARIGWRCSAVAVTLGKQGALLVDGGGSPLVVPPPVTGDANPCGAGDSFAGAAVAALAEGAITSEAVQSAVAQAAAFVAGGGLHGIQGLHGRDGLRESQGSSGSRGFEDADEVLRRVRAAGGRVVATCGCFDLLHAGHLATLRAARALGDCLIVCLNSDRSVRDLKGPGRPLNREADRRAMLAALECVDAVVVFDEPQPLSTLERLRPDVWVKGGDYDAAALPEHDLVERCGGQCVVVPYVDGRSTSELIELARR